MDVLITHYEQQSIIKDSINSLTTQLSDKDTIHVVDAGSTDGSFHILEGLDADGKINLVYRDGVSRGQGRQIAFEESDADIIVAQADLDTIFHPILEQLKYAYQRICSKQGAGVLLVHGCLITDRSTINSIGGWNDLQVHEDKDLWTRAEDIATLYQMPISVVQRHDNFEWESMIYRFKRRYQNYRDAIRLGIPRVTLNKSYRHQQSIDSWPVNRALLSTAARRAKNMKSYGTLKEEYPDPEKFHLQELTFHALVKSQIINPEVLQVPSELEQYRSEQSYPGKTSYR